MRVPRFCRSQFLDEPGVVRFDVCMGFCDSVWASLRMASCGNDVGVDMLW